MVRSRNCENVCTFSTCCNYVVPSGAQIPAGSSASSTINTIIFIVYTWFAFFVLYMRPQVLPLMYFVVVIGAFLEAGAAFCVVWLTMNPSSASAQLGMFAQQVSVGDRRSAELLQGVTRG